MRALNVMSADVHGCLQFPDSPFGRLLDPQEDHQHNFYVSSWGEATPLACVEGTLTASIQPAGDLKQAAANGRSPLVLHGQAFAIASFARSP